MSVSSLNPPDETPIRSGKICQARRGRVDHRSAVSGSCRKLLGLNPALPEVPHKSPQDLMLELTGIDISRCPKCKKGTMVIVAELPKLRPWDSS